MVSGLSRFFWISAIAFPLALLAMPATRWAVLGHFRMAVTDVRSYDGNGTDAYVELPKGDDRASQLAGLQEPNRWGNVDTMYLAAKRHWGDVLFLSAFINGASADARLDEHSASKPGSQGDATDWKRLLEACEQGIQLEPENAFFPAIAAAAEEGLGATSESLDYLRDAATRTHWTDHSAEINRLARQAYIQSFGYRGWNALVSRRPGLCGGLLADLGRKLSKRPLDPARVAAMRDLYAIAKLSYDQAVYFDELALAPEILHGLANSRDQDIHGRLAETAKTLAKQPDVLDPVKPDSVATTVKEMLNADADYSRPMDVVLGSWLDDFLTPYGMGRFAAPLGSILQLVTLALTMLYLVCNQGKRPAIRRIRKLAGVLAVIGSFLYCLTALCYVAMDNKAAARGGWGDESAAKFREFSRQYPFTVYK